MARWRALSWNDRRALLAACLLIPLMWLGLRTAGLATVHGWALARRPNPPADASGAARALQLVRLVRVAGRRMPPLSTCLTRSLAALWLVQRAGLPGRLCIGVRPLAGALQAHAWLECDGVPLAEPDGVSARFASLGDLAAPAAAARDGWRTRAGRL